MVKYIRQRGKQIEWAWSGLVDFFKTEAHARVHLSAAILVIVIGFVLSVNSMEWVALFVAIGLVMQAEIFNSVMENILDFVHPDQHAKIKRMKDMSAGAVLWTSLIAVIIGGIVFLPYLFELLG